MATFFYGPDTTVHPHAGEDLPAEIYLALADVLQDARVLVNAHTGGHTSREVDLTIITPNSVYVAEVKDVRSPIRATANGPWFVIDAEGHERQMVNPSRGQLESPVLQAQHCAKAVEASLRALAPLGAWVDTLKVFAYVLIPYPSAQNEIDYHGGPVRVVQSIERFLSSVIDREYPRAVGPLGYGLTAAAATAYVARLGLVPYDLMTLVHNGRPSPVVVRPVKHDHAHRTAGPRLDHPGAEYDAMRRAAVVQGTAHLKKRVQDAQPPEPSIAMTLPAASDAAPAIDEPSQPASPLVSQARAWQRFAGRVTSALHGLLAMRRRG